MPPTGGSGSWGPEHVRLGDIDGDGRADICLIDEPGDVLCWRNAGQNVADKPAGWMPFTQATPSSDGSAYKVFPTKNKGDRDGLHLVDINGNFRYDWVWLSKSGASDIYINYRGWQDGIVPDWRQAKEFHPPVLSSADADGYGRFVFGRIFGTGRHDVSDDMSFL